MAQLSNSKLGTCQQSIVNTTVTTCLLNPIAVESTYLRFPGKSYKLTHATALLFKSGKVVIVGSKSMDEISKSLLEVAEKLGATGNYTISNVVASLNFVGKINLMFLSKQLKCNYFNDEYHGLKVKLATGATCLLYHTGKVIVTGCKDFQVCQESINIIKDIVESEIWRHMLQLQMLD